MAEFDAGAIRGRLTLDRADFFAGIDQAEAKGDEFDGKEYKARLGADDAEARAEIERLQAELDHLSDRDYRAHLSVDGLAEADARIEELKGRLDELRAKEELAGARGEEAFGKTAEEAGKAREEVDKAKGAVDRLSGLGGGEGFGGLIGIAAALAPAMVPALGAITFGIGAMLPVLTSAGLGFASLGLLASPILSNIKQDMTTLNPLLKAFEDAQPGPQQAAAWKALQQAIDKLPPGEREVARGLIDVKRELFDLSQQLKPALLDAFGKGLQFVKDLLPTLLPLAQAAARGLGDLFSQLDHFAKSPAWAGFVAVMARQVEPAITALGVAFGGLLRGIGLLAVAFAPFANRIEGDLLNLVHNFDDWSRRLAAPGGLNKFIDYINKNGPLLHNLLTDLDNLLKTLFRDIANTGITGAELKALDSLAKVLNTLFSIPGFGPFLANMLLFSSILSRLKIGAAIAGITDFVILLSGGEVEGASRGLVLLTSGLRGLTSVLASYVGTYLWQPIVAGLETLGGAVTTALGAVFSLPGAVIAGIVAEAAAVVLSFTDSFRKNLIQHLPKAVQDGINHAAGAIKDLFSILFPPAAAIRAILDSHFRTAVADFFTKTLPGAIASYAGLTGRAFVALFTRIIPEVLGAIGRLGLSMLQAAGRAMLSLLQGFVGALPGILSFFAQLPFRILTFLVTLPLKLLDLGIKALDALVQGINAAAPAVWNFFSSLPGKALGFIEHLVGDLLAFGIRALGGMASGIASGASAVWNFFTSLPGKVLGFLERLPGDLLSLGSRALSSMASGATSGASGVWTFIQSIPGRILSLLGDLGSLLLNAGSELVHGLATGIEHGITGFLSSAVNHLKSIVSDAGNLLGHVFGSPSKTAHQWGLWIVQGLAQGLAAAAPLLARVAGSLASIVNGIVGGVLGGAGIGGLGATAAPSVSSSLSLGGNVVHIAGSADQSVIGALQAAMTVNNQRLMQELSARGFRFPNAIPGLT